jgi:hypothetical protein
LYTIAEKSISSYAKKVNIIYVTFIEGKQGSGGIKRKRRLWSSTLIT